jgi:hypothetical protein
MVKLFSYSSDPPGIVEVKWIKTRIAIMSLVIAAMLFLGSIELGFTISEAPRSRSANLLETENNYLKQEILSISPRVTRLEVRTKQLSEHADALHTLLTGRNMSADSISRLKSVFQEVALHPMNPVATNIGR